MTKRVLLTGASGLLGRSIYQAFDQDPSWELLGLAFSRAKGALRKVDITCQHQVRDIIDEFKPSIIIHSAAERRPDVIEQKEEAAIKLNIEATQILCQNAVRVGAIVVFISTDYVFDGKNPPYQVGDEPNPLSKYGNEKLEGEGVTLQSNKKNVVIRVPIMYGTVDYLEESAVTTLFPKVKDSSKTFNVSDHERRFPTHCDDVAFVLKSLLEKKLQDENLHGIFHWSSDENMTKYDMALAMANVFSLSKEHIFADKTPGKGRPYNSHLDTTRIEQLGICKRTNFRDGIGPCLKAFLQ